MCPFCSRSFRAELPLQSHMVKKHHHQLEWHGWDRDILELLRQQWPEGTAHAARLEQDPTKTARTNNSPNCALKTSNEGELKECNKGYQPLPLSKSELESNKDAQVPAPKPRYIPDHLSPALEASLGPKLVTIVEAVRVWLRTERSAFYARGNYQICESTIASYVADMARVLCWVRRKTGLDGEPAISALFDTNLVRQYLDYMEPKYAMNSRINHLRCLQRLGHYIEDKLSSNYFTTELNNPYVMRLKLYPWQDWLSDEILQFRMTILEELAKAEAAQLALSHSQGSGDAAKAQNVPAPSEASAQVPSGFRMTILEELAKAEAAQLALSHSQGSGYAMRAQNIPVSAEVLPAHVPPGFAVQTTPKVCYATENVNHYEPEACIIDGDVIEEVMDSGHAYDFDYGGTNIEQTSGGFWTRLLFDDLNFGLFPHQNTSVPHEAGGKVTNAYDCGRARTECEEKEDLVQIPAMGPVDIFPFHSPKRQRTGLYHGGEISPMQGSFGLEKNLGAIEQQQAAQVPLDGNRKRQWQFHFDSNIGSYFY